MKKHTIYLASSWRNETQPAVLAMLRESGHEVYDFRNPAPDDAGFSWRQIFPEPPETWSPEKLAEALRHPVAKRGHGFDQGGMNRATVCVLLLPSSAHLEAGWCAGRGIPTIAYAPTTIREPELMYLSFCRSHLNGRFVGDSPGPLVTKQWQLLDWLEGSRPGRPRRPGVTAADFVDGVPVAEPASSEGAGTERALTLLTDLVDAVEHAEFEVVLDESPWDRENVREKLAAANKLLGRPS